jgi:hypothetical protein
MNNDDDMIIREAARKICATQEAKSDTNTAAFYALGKYDHTIWMRLVEQGIRKGIEIGRLL